MRIIQAAKRVGATVVVAGGLVHFGGMTFVENAYPTDAVKRAALATCSAADPGFVRFLAGERALCYARLHLS